MTNEIRFADLGLPKEVLSAIEAVGYETPSPIQAQSIPALLEGRDLLGLAQTGTGKTAAFALPLLANIDVSKRRPQALILAPTRELAIQVSEALQNYATNIKGFHVAPIYGGQDMRSQLRALSRGVHVVVGTPGRVMDHIRRNSLDLSELSTLVLDEADEMLRMGFIDDVEWILKHTPDDRQLALFSATMPGAIKKITDNYLSDPYRVEIEAKTKTVERIEQVVYEVHGARKMDALTRVLEVEEFDGIIMFVRTKTATMELAQKLEARGYSSAAINGDMSQQQREKTIDMLKKGTVDIVIATDVAARGIDVARITHVINFDIPYDNEAYVHRIGRTGRAGRSGKAILFITHRERHLLRSIERSTGQGINRCSLPTHEQITDQRQNQFKQKILDALNSDALDNFKQIIDDLINQTETDPIDVAAALALLAQQDKPLFVEKDRLLDEPPRTRQDKRENGERRQRRERVERDPSIQMNHYRIQVGRQHGAQVKDIVGAIANEAGIESQFIGRIKLGDSVSYVDLPEGMPGDVLQTLRNTRIRQQQTQIEQVDGSEIPRDNHRKGGEGDNRSRKPRGRKEGGQRDGNRPPRKPRQGQENRSPRKPRPQGRDA